MYRLVIRDVSEHIKLAKLMLVGRGFRPSPEILEQLAVVTATQDPVNSVVLVSGSTWHTGYSTSTDVIVCEASNFAPESWLEVGMHYVTHTYIPHLYTLC